MEELNQTSFDKSDFKNFIKNSTNDTEWIEAFDGVVDQCIDHLSYYTKILQQLYKVNGEDCDIKYQAYLTCINLVSHKVRNDQFWKNFINLLDFFEKKNLRTPK